MKTPILILAHRRPEHLRRCLDKLMESGVQNIYASVDGPTSANDSEHQAVQKMILAIGEKLSNHQFLKDNLGCKKGVEGGMDWFFSKVDSGIIIEEDVLISQSGLKFLSYGLNHLKGHEGVSMLGAHLPTGSWENGMKPIRSTLGTIWGWATWKEKWLQHRSAFDRLCGDDIHMVIRNTFSDTSVAKNLEAAVDQIRKNQLDTWGFPWNFSLLKNKGCCVLPPVNQVENIGISEDALHTKALHAEVCNKIGAPLEVMNWSGIQKIDLSFETEWFRRLKGRKHELRTSSDRGYLSATAPNRELNLTFINTTEKGGGAEKIFMRLLEAKKSNSGLVGVRKSDHPQILEIGKPSGIKFPFPSAKTLDSAIDTLSYRPNLIHIHNLHGTGIGLKEVLKLADRIPIIWTLHDQWLLGKNEIHPYKLDERLPSMNQKVFNHPNIHFTAPSVWLQDLVFTKTGRLPYLIRHGIDTSVFNPKGREKGCEQLGMDPSKKRLLFIANNPETNPYKDFNTLKRAWQNVNGYDLICLGSRISKTETVGENQIQFVPFEDNEETVAYYLNAADCLVHATKSDVSSLSILEAFACRTPVIAAAVEGIPELLVGERHGRLFSSSSVDDLASAISNLNQDPDSTIEKVEAAHQYLSTNHDAESAMSSYLGLYAKITS